MNMISQENLWEELGPIERVLIFYVIVKTTGHDLLLNVIGHLS